VPVNTLAGRVRHVSELEEVWVHLWEANRLIADAYELDLDDLAHVLSSFDVLSRKRPTFFAYLQNKVPPRRE
jgi:transcriptional regulator of nitric oxide reductase